MAVWPSVEIRRLNPHLIPYGVPQFIPDQSLITPTTVVSYYAQMVTSGYAKGGSSPGRTRSAPPAGRCSPKLSRTPTVGDLHLDDGRRAVFHRHPRRRLHGAWTGRRLGVARALRKVFVGGIDQGRSAE